MRAAAESDIDQEIHDLAAQIAVVAGHGKLTNPDMNSSDCESNGREASDDVIDVLGAYNIDLPRAKHREGFVAVRDHWRNLGWTIKDDRYRADLNEGSLTAEDPQTGANFTLTSTKSADSLAVILQSGCFRKLTESSPPMQPTNSVSTPQRTN